MYYGDSSTVSAVSMNKTENASPLKKLYNAGVNFTETLAQTTKATGLHGPSLFGNGFAGNSNNIGGTITQ